MASAQGKNNKLLKKIYKALKMPQDSTYLQDIVDIANNKVTIQFLGFLVRVSKYLFTGAPVAFKA
jgi:hypothetical protein